MIVKANCEYYKGQKATNYHIKNSSINVPPVMLHFCLHPENNSQEECNVISNSFCLYCLTKSKWVLPVFSIWRLLIMVFSKKLCPGCGHVYLVRINRKKWMRKFLPGSLHYHCHNCKANYLLIFGFYMWPLGRSSRGKKELVWNNTIIQL